MTGLFGALRLPASVVLGSGQRASIGALVAKIGRRALVCTDTRLAADAQFRGIVADMEANGITVKVYDRTQADVPLESIAECLAECAAFAPDVMLGVGGGSCMDMAKAISLMLRHGGDIRSYYGEHNVPGPIIPVIAVPTTSGTGSEVTPIAIVGDTERQIKVGISSPYLIPHAAICDPELTISCPSALTSCSGVDALTHAVEAYTALPRVLTGDLTNKSVSVGKNVLSDSFALLAIDNIWRSLKRCTDNGNDIEARERMMLAALAAGCAFSTAGVAAAHALQYPVGNATHTPHGVGVALLLPYVMEFNRPNCVTAFADIARTIGLNGKSDEQLSKDVIQAIADFLVSVGIPRTLKDLGLAADKQDWTAESAFGAARLVNNNPRKLDVEALRRITHAAFSGDRAALAS